MGPRSHLPPPPLPVRWALTIRGGEGNGALARQRGSRGERRRAARAGEEVLAARGGEAHARAGRRLAPRRDPGIRRRQARRGLQHAAAPERPVLEEPRAHRLHPAASGGEAVKEKKGAEKLKRKVYEKELENLHVELVKLQEWVKHEGARICIVFEGRDT